MWHLLSAPKPGRLEISFESNGSECWIVTLTFESYLLLIVEKAIRWELKMKVDSWQFIPNAGGGYKELNSSESECT